MAALADTSAHGASNPFLPTARRLGRSPIMRILAALFVLMIFFWLAWFVREHRDHAAKMLAAGLTILGLLLAWNLLPFSEKKRARPMEAHRWREEDQRIDDSWSRVFRNGLWLGPAILLSQVFDQFWMDAMLRLPPSRSWIEATAFFAIGLLAQWRHARTRSRQ